MEFHDYCLMLLPFKSYRRKEIPLSFVYFLHSSIAIVLTLIYIHNTLGLWDLSFLGINIPLHIWETFAHYFFKLQFYLLTYCMVAYDVVCVYIICMCVYSMCVWWVCG